MTTTSKDDGGPAFPTPDGSHARSNLMSTGMSLRDWFAGMVASGPIFDTHDDAQKVADFAYRIADAMLIVRKEPTEDDRNTNS